MTAKDALVGSLVGLANTATGNSWKADTQTDSIVRAGLELLKKEAGEEAYHAHVQAVHAEKDRLAPDCAVCKNPCGRNFDYDMEQLYSSAQDIRSMKILLLCALMHAHEDMPFVYRALRALGDEWTPERLLPILLEAGERNMLDV